jgi:hypothetical protein
MDTARATSAERAASASATAERAAPAAAANAAASAEQPTIECAADVGNATAAAGKPAVGH